MLIKALITISAITLLYLGLATYAYAFAERLIFPKVPPSYTKDDSIFYLKSIDGERIAATLLQAKNSSTLLLYSHGNGEDIGHGHPLFQTFQKNHISVLAYDYPGYGLSTGKASEQGVYAAIETTYKYATDTLGYKPANIILYGRSLGSGPSCWLAARHTPGGMILDGAFTSTFRVITRKKLLPWDRFDNLKRLPSINCPILLLHGTADKIVPFSHAKTNYAAIKSPKKKLWVDGAGHNDLIDLASTPYWENVLSFIQTSTSQNE